MDKLPPILLYSKYLQIASLRFNLGIDKCRDKFGLYTKGQWLRLFNQKKTKQ